MALTKNTSNIKYSEQEILNISKDDLFDILAVLPVGYTPPASEGGESTANYSVSGDTTLRIAEKSSDPDILYIGHAGIGAVETDAVWRIKEFNLSGVTVVKKYADGNANFDNIWNNREVLTYT